jgi:MFS family permease
MLSGADAVSQVVAAEQTNHDNRALGVAVVAAGYGVGAGLVAILHSVGLGRLGFRGLFALSLVPLAALLMIRRRVTEPDRYTALVAAKDAKTDEARPVPVVGVVGPRFRRRLVIVVVLAFAVSVITGPANGFVFLYAQNIIHQSGSTTAVMVMGAGVTGLVGLLIGRWLADHVGRRPTSVVGMAALAGCGVLAYSGSSGAMIGGSAGRSPGTCFESCGCGPASCARRLCFPRIFRSSRPIRLAGTGCGRGIAGRPPAGRRSARRVRGTSRDRDNDKRPFYGAVCTHRRHPQTNALAGGQGIRMLTRDEAGR